MNRKPAKSYTILIKVAGSKVNSYLIHSPCLLPKNKAVTVISASSIEGVKKKDAKEAN